MADGFMLQGVVEPGRGLGVPLMSQGDILARIRELMGQPVLPGTLNLRLAESLDRDLLTNYLTGSEVSPDWESTTGQLGYFWEAALIEGRYQAVVMQADEPGYPPDQIEVLSGTHLRGALELEDGDSVQLRFVSS